MIREFFQRKTVGFYLSCAAAVLAVVTGFIYRSGFKDQAVYYSTAAVALPIVAAGTFLLLCPFRWTEKYAPLTLLILSFIGFLVYIHTVYMYLSEVFYAGINADTIALLSKEFIFSTLFYLLTIIFSNIGVWMKQSKVTTEHAGEKL